jgi:hypothetical protein
MVKAGSAKTGLLPARLKKTAVAEAKARVRMEMLFIFLSVKVRRVHARFHGVYAPYDIPACGALRLP